MTCMRSSSAGRRPASQRSEPMPGPLHGVRVLDLSRVLAGPWAGQVLADLGAEVIKVERPGSGDDTRAWGPPFLRTQGRAGRGESAYYLSANRGKKSVTIDFDKPEGQALVKRLAARAISCWKISNSAAWPNSASDRRPAHAQPEADLLLDHRLRPDRPVPAPRGL